MYVCIYVCMLYDFKKKQSNIVYIIHIMYVFKKKT